MRVRGFDDRFIVRIEAGERVVATLVEFLRSEAIGFANLSATGAFGSCQVGFWDPDQRAYAYRRFDEQLEVVSFVGNASLRDGQPFLHLHVALGRSDLSVVGGHLQEAMVHPTLEVWLRTEDVDVRRVHDPSTGLDLLELPPHRTRRRPDVSLGDRSARWKEPWALLRAAAPGRLRSVSA